MSDRERVDEFEYKGKNISVTTDGEGNFSFSYIEKGKEIYMPFEDIEEFISSPYSHTTINNNEVDMIEKSVKINDFLFNLKDLKAKITKYKQ